MICMVNEKTKKPDTKLLSEMGEYQSGRLYELVENLKPTSSDWKPGDVLYAAGYVVWNLNKQTYCALKEDGASKYRVKIFEGEITLSNNDFIRLY